MPLGPVPRKRLSVVPSPSSPMAVARALAAEVFTSADGALTLRQHRGGFYCWSGRHWPAMPSRDVRGIAYVWLEHVQYHHPEKDELQAFNPTRRKIDDVIDALKAVVMLDSAADAPCWTDGTEHPARRGGRVGGERVAARPDSGCAPPRAGVLQPSLAAVPIRARVRPAGPVAQVPGSAVG